MLSRATQKRLKRLMDVMAAVTGLAILCGPMAVVWVAVRLRMGPPAIFRQRRVGCLGRTFTIYKFRTMSASHDVDDVDPRTDGARLTRLGRFLRKTSLDELPELVNVLKGDMSLVGPRPLLPQYLPLYTPTQARRHEVRPGLTGWAQVNGRNAVSWEGRFELDVWYVDNWSLALDARILWMTLLRVARGEGVSAEGHETMPLFTGTSRAAE